MARIRSIKPHYFRSPSVAELPSDACRITWIGIWTYCDDAGRGADDARLVKGEIWPLHDRITAKVVESHLVALAMGDDPMICRYLVGNRRYLHVINWSEHQRINRPSISLIPPCPIHEPDGADSVSPHGTLTEGSYQEVEVEVEVEGSEGVGTGTLLSSSSHLHLLGANGRDEEEVA